MLSGFIMAAGRRRASTRPGSGVRRSPPYHGSTQLFSGRGGRLRPLPFPFFGCDGARRQAVSPRR
ncbi:hypothetical protein, partial [Thermobifida fusca]|uniref:hypothetical protein n=1 Tax=Thermobifida fusca TaxID=2021 RepID=UPI001EE722DC